MKKDILQNFERNLGYFFSNALERPLTAPLWVYISLSHKCTYNCQMCGVVKILNGFELPTGAVKSAIDQIKYWNSCPAIVLTGGEPFLRKDIFEIISYAAVNKIRIETVSNGSLIGEELADKIIASGLSNIAVSLDGAIEETHDYIRQKGAFKNATQAIKWLTAAKKRRGCGPQISVWTTIMKENVSELSDIALLVKELGIDCLVYHPVIVAQDDMQNTSADAHFWLRGKDIDILKRQIDEILDFKKTYGLVEFLHDPYLWAEHFLGTLKIDAWKCNPFVFLNIGPDGEIRSCGASFGNMHKLGLDACLNTAEARQARAVMKNCPKPCLQTCWANPESDSLARAVDSFISKINNANFSKEEKEGLLREALNRLSYYEKMVGEINA